MPTVLNPVTVYTRSMLAGQLAVSGPFAPIKVDVFDIESVNVAGDVSEEGETDVHAKIGATASNHSDADRRDCKRVSHDSVAQ
jgi:hypothetical protein